MTAWVPTAFGIGGARDGKSYEEWAMDQAKAPIEQVKKPDPVCYRDPHSKAEVGAIKKPKPKKPRSIVSK